jgi:hypothetical protein
MLLHLTQTPKTIMETNKLASGAVYMSTIRSVVTKYAGRNDKFMAIICMGRQINYTSAFTNINAARQCSC